MYGRFFGMFFNKVHHTFSTGIKVIGSPAYAQQKTGGAIVSFEVKGNQKEAWSLIDSTRLISITANLGDVKSTITHPATTTHSRVSLEERQKAGIKDNLVRIAVGLEDIEDLKADLSSLSR